MKSKITALIIAIAVLFLCTAPVYASSTIISYPMPDNMPSQYISSSFSVDASGNTLPVYHVGSNAWGANVDCCSFELLGTTTISVTTNFAFSTARILPRNAAISCNTNGNTVTFTIASPQNITILFDENFQGAALHIFAQAPESNVPDLSTSDVIYFGPGFYDYSESGPILLGSGQTLYIDAGAVVRARVAVHNADNVTICGRGVLLNDFTTSDNYDSVALAIKRSNNITIRDVSILRNAASWSAFMWQCGNVTVDNVHIINPKYACSDGFDIANSHDVTFNNLFIRSADDSIAIKGTGTSGYNVNEDPANAQPNYNITIQNTQVWSDTNNALGIGAESVAAYYSNITFKNIDILYNYDDYTYPNQLKDRSAINICILNATNLSDITFEDIRVEQAKRLISITMKDSFWFGSLPGNWDWDGAISGITYRNITSYSTGSNEIQIMGYDSAHPVSDIIFDNIIVNGSQISSFSDNKFKVNSYANNLTLKDNNMIQDVCSGAFGANVYSNVVDYTDVQGHNGWYYRTWTNGEGNADMVWNSDGSYHWRGYHNYDAIWMYDAQFYIHPDNDQTMLEWVASDNGSVRILGNVKKYDTSGGDGVVISIWKNDSLIWPAAGWTNIVYDDSTGLNHDFTIQVDAGDIISFRVDEGENNGYDTTIWNTEIIYDSYE